MLEVSVIERVFDGFGVALADRQLTDHGADQFEVGDAVPLERGSYRPGHRGVAVDHELDQRETGAGGVEFGSQLVDSKTNL